MLLEIEIYNPDILDVTYKNASLKMQAKINLNNIDFISKGYAGMTKTIVLNYNYAYSSIHAEFTYEDIQKLTDNYFVSIGNYLVNESNIVMQTDTVIYFKNSMLYLD